MATKIELKDAAEDEYEKVRGPAYAEYLKVEGPAYAEYEKVRDAALAEYQKVHGPAEAKYKKRLAEIDAMPDDEEDPAVTAAIKLLKSKGYATPVKEE